MLIYQLKIEIKQYNPVKFVNSMRSFLPKICHQKDCLDFSMYQDSEKENTYIVVGEWKTRQAMEKHFKTREFELLIGVARVLGEVFVMNIAEVSKTGGFELAKEQILANQTDWTPDRIDKVTASGKTTTVHLKTPMRILLLYGTVGIRDGNVHFRDDIYKRDSAVLKALDGEFKVRKRDR